MMKVNLMKELFKLNYIMGHLKKIIINVFLKNSFVQEDTPYKKY